MADHEIDDTAPQAGDAARRADDPEVQAEETKRRFRDALDRKQRHHHASAEGAPHDGSEKSHGAQGPTKGRTFRRKSG